MKAKRFFASLPVVLLFVLTGCSVRIVNLTPSELSVSPNGTYTLKAQAKVEQRTVVPDSLEAFVVIDGEQYPMTKKPGPIGLFEYDYQPPSEKLFTRFYYVLNYTVHKKNQNPILKQIISNIYRLRLPNLIQLKLDRQRAAVETQVSIFGGPFSSEDSVMIDGAICETVFISSEELQFVVPDFKPGFGYEVQVYTASGLHRAGLLRIDAANPLNVLPQKLALRLGQQQALAFVLDYPAPIGGLYINVTTDIPDSIIMPEVLIPEGVRTVSATIEGDTVGNGHLFINASGLPEIVVPVTIR